MERLGQLVTKSPYEFSLKCLASYILSSLSALENDLLTRIPLPLAFVVNDKRHV